MNDVQEDHGLMKQFFWNIHGTIFEGFFVTSRQDIYDQMCGLHAYNKENDKSTDEANFFVEDPYQIIIMQFFLFLFMSVLTL